MSWASGKNPSNSLRGEKVRVRTRTPGPSDTVRDAPGQVEPIEPPAAPGRHVLDAYQMPERFVPVQVLIERSAQDTVHDDPGALERPAASNLSGS